MLPEMIDARGLKHRFEERGKGLYADRERLAEQNGQSAQEREA